MTVWKKSELLEALSQEALWNNLEDSIIIDEVIIDSRKQVKNGLFIALHGDNNNGHDFLLQALENGCNVAIIHDQTKAVFNQNYILVKNTFVALYKIAEYARKRSRAKIIAITGSVGKTSTKEMLKMAFETQGKTYATTGNLNNHIGLPLSLCNFPRDCKYGIFEMGMNHLGEIEPLSKLARPHLAMITNVGPVHIEYFKNEEEIALAKSEIFSGLEKNGTALINHDNRHFYFLQKRAEFYETNPQNILNFGQEKTSDYQILNYQISSAESCQVKAKLKNQSIISYKISTSHTATIFNSIVVLAALDLLGHDLPLGISALEKITIPQGRGKTFEITVDNKKIVIIDDSYNASVPSMHAGLQHAAFLKKILNKKRVIAALGDMLELGKKSVELHKEIVKDLKKMDIDFAVLVGSNMTEVATDLPKEFYQTFSNSNQASLEIKNLIADGDIIYIKGSRGMKMEKIIEKLS